MYPNLSGSLFQPGSVLMRPLGRGLVTVYLGELQLGRTVLVGGEVLCLTMLGKRGWCNVITTWPVVDNCHTLVCVINIDNNG